MKNILGLDLGPNSIGWALLHLDCNSRYGNIVDCGVRIIPMSQDILGDYNKGIKVSQTAERTKYRSMRRLRERYLLRRERLHRVLYLLKFLPSHYADEIDFQKRLGKFKEGREPKIAYDKNGFIFMSSFLEMMEDFRIHQPALLINEKGEPKSIPYDWTLYYLRKKALTAPIRKEELAWLLLNFNQKRGYYQLGGDEEESSLEKNTALYTLKVVDVIAEESKKGGDQWYSLTLENGWVYRRSSKLPLFDLKGKIRDFIVTTDLNADGSVKKDKKGGDKRSLRIPEDKDWILLKKQTEQEIGKFGSTVGAYIYENLLKDPYQRINGKLVGTIEREFYKSELKQILEKQMEFHTELQSEEMYSTCIRELYKQNDGHHLNLSRKDFVHFFVDDIIFYQRQVKSQRSMVSNCPLEFRYYKDKDGVVQKVYLKAIPKSNPYYQEFRLWQWIHNLFIYRKEDDVDVTATFLNDFKELENLFIFLNGRAEIEQRHLLGFLLGPKGFKGKLLNKEVDKYRWNYGEKSFPCNETRTLICKRLEKINNVPADFLTKEIEMHLWHINYSVSDRIDREKAFTRFATNNNLDVNEVVNAFKVVPPLKSDFGAFSEKAIKKLLPLMRVGSYWNWEAMDVRTRERIGKIITGEYDERIGDRLRKQAIHLKKETDFQRVPVWLAQYIIYGFHSESQMADKWTSIQDLESYLKCFKQHSLRNPIVEQVVLEALRLVKDIWKEHGKGANNFFDEIHIELSREMKSPAEERKSMSLKALQNENTNLRIKALLSELANDQNVENVRAYSPSQQEILKIYEEGVLNTESEIGEDILKISKMAQPSPADLRKYKLWLEQKYRSPYTGAIIPLNKLFTTEYEIEHIIPQSRYFDDGFSNKVICEAAVNKLKDNQLGMEFIKNHHGEIVQLGFGKTIQILAVEQYEKLVKENYVNNSSKRNKLLLEEIPEKMIERQLNDTRYISSYISGLLSNIVRQDTDDNGFNSKNLIQTNGRITGILRQDWGLNDVWNSLILPRFERMNKITNSSQYVAWSETHQKNLPTVPLTLKNFSKKRIDHRHHALDAIVTACVTRDHINLLNNLHAKSPIRHDLNRKLRHHKSIVLNHHKTGEKIERQIPVDFRKPWEDFTLDVKSSLENIIVSFKLNLRVINKTINNYYVWEVKDGVKQKVRIRQSGENWAIRKPLHKETVYGIVNLPHVKVKIGQITTASRKNIDVTFDLSVIENSITDTGIQRILKNYLEFKNGDPEIAFSPEGLEELNQNLRKFNEGKFHHPIYKVRKYEKGYRFVLGEVGYKSTKYVEAERGTNLFCAIYCNTAGARSYETIPLNIIIERQKQGLPSVPQENSKGEKLLFHLSPNDLVYIPDEEELSSHSVPKFEINNKKHIGRIYKVVNFSDNQIFFIKHEVATSILHKQEFSTSNKMERSIDGIMIKEHCIKLNISRIGKLISDK
ncbi:CRISPR-associated endonuclease Csn1 [Chitinophaga dinghuensis]|uniref:CRISPR-associated endonuclease Cas9 n=1 Tax=Chitinophaga dinghuensis TaxID=1539050 RepID=A0A327WFW3_9BACT|nr:type II CRISPR RNA-guided endonuclease Cas9 [Chitinophaga dinghuensis]RAJ88256.1 CRISPR-associated endonuclease Csn1 [Chitinophaga dinghuensis]